MGFLFELISAIICIGMKIYWGHFLNNVLYDLWLYAPCWNSSWYFLVDLSHLVTISMLPDPAIGHFHSALCFSFRWKKLKLLCYLSKDIHDNKSSFFYFLFFFIFFKCWNLNSNEHVSTKGNVYHEFRNWNSPCIRLFP